MALNSTPPIERRPMTTKQARKRWQKRGCPTISSAEQRRLDRAAELERRAQTIRDKDKRQKENAKKRKEKEGREKEKKQRMGVEEPVKLPEGQLGLVQFFKTKISNTRSNKTLDENITIRQDQDALEEEDRGESEDEKSDAEQYHEQTLTFDLLRSSGKKRKLEENAEPDINSQMSGRLRRAPLGELDMNIQQEPELPPLPPSSQQPSQKSKKPSFFANYAAYKAAKVAKSAPASRQLTPENEIISQQANSAPSTASQRALREAESVENGPVPQFHSIPQEDLPRPKKPKSSPRRSQRLSQRARSQLSEGSISTTLASGQGIDQAYSNQLHVGSIQPIPNQEDVPILPEPAPNSITDHSISSIELEAEPPMKNSSPRSKHITSLTDSFGGIYDDDLLDIEAYDGIPTTITEEAEVADPIGDLVKSPAAQIDHSQALHSPPAVSGRGQRLPLAKVASTQSFACDFSSQDLALLDEAIQTNSTTSEDGFDLPGCTQDLEALIEEGKEDTYGTGHQEKARAAMPPPPVPKRPPNSAAKRLITPAPLDDDIDYLHGSTQAFLDL